MGGGGIFSPTAANSLVQTICLEVYQNNTVQLYYSPPICTKRVSYVLRAVKVVMTVSSWSDGVHFDMSRIISGRNKLSSQRFFVILAGIGLCLSP